MSKSNIGEGIAFFGLCGSAALLEIFDKPAGGLWLLIVLWVLLSSFKITEEKEDDRLD